MKILLTGSDGFIGKNVYKRINDNIAPIEIFCIEKDFINSVNWKTDLEEYVKQNDVVLHIGAISDTMLKDANKMMKYNYLFSKELFDLAQKHNKKVVYSSSAANTGESGTPSNIYGWSKFITEQYGLAKVNNFYALRYFNVYGPGEEHKGKMASVAHQAWKIGSFTLFPKKPERDFVYIDDFTKGLEVLMKKGKHKGIYNFSSGIPTKITQLCVIASKILKKKYLIKKNKKFIRNIDTSYLVGDNQKMIELGCTLKVNLKSAIKKIITNRLNNL